MRAVKGRFGYLFLKKTSELGEEHLCLDLHLRASASNRLIRQRGMFFPDGASRGGWSLMIFCARATRGLRRASLDEYLISFSHPCEIGSWRPGEGRTCAMGD